MNTTFRGFVLTAALVGALGFGARAARADDMKDVPLMLTGCVVAGEAKNSFLLTDVEIDGTTLAPTHAFYRLNDSDRLKPHVGRRVEVRGTADLDDVDKGRLRVETHDGKVTTEIKSERRKVKLEDVWFGSVGSVKIDAEIPTYKFDVLGVRPVEGGCTR